MLLDSSLTAATPLSFFASQDRSKTLYLAISLTL